MERVEIAHCITRGIKMIMLNATISSCFLWKHICNFVSFIKTCSNKFYQMYIKKCNHVYRGVKITTDRPHIRPLFETICLAPKFLNWLEAFPLDKFDLRSINFTDVDFFGANNNPAKLGFLKFTCDVYTKSGEPVDGIVFLRGDCGAVLIIAVDENGKEYVLLTEQPRIPTCGYKEEIVAGMFDAQKGNTVVNNVLKKEIKEETGLDLDETSQNYVRLGEYTLSGGGSDEKVHLAIWTTKICSSVISEMKTKQFGEQYSNEKIRLKFYPVENFEKELFRIADAKTSLAWHLYNKNSLF